jgi:hypothetical protein
MKPFAFKLLASSPSQLIFPGENTVIQAAANDFHHKNLLGGLLTAHPGKMPVHTRRDYRGESQQDDRRSQSISMTTVDCLISIQ